MSTCSPLDHHGYGYQCTCVHPLHGVNCGNDSMVTQVKLPTYDLLSLPVPERGIDFYAAVWFVQGLPNCIIDILITVPLWGGFIEWEVKQIDAPESPIAEFISSGQIVSLSTTHRAIWISIRDSDFYRGDGQIQMRSRCEEDILTCSDDPCSVLSACSQFTGGYWCHCFAGFGGFNCDTAYNVYNVEVGLQQTTVVTSPSYPDTFTLGSPISWHVQGLDGYDVGVSFPDGISLYQKQSAFKMTTEHGNFINVIPVPHSTVSFYILVRSVSFWLSVDASKQGNTFPGFKLEFTLSDRKDTTVLCDARSCSTRSECKAFVVGYTCICPSGFTGPKCSNATDIRHINVEHNYTMSYTYNVGHPPKPLLQVESQNSCGVGLKVFDASGLSYVDVMTSLTHADRFINCSHSCGKESYHFVKSTVFYVDIVPGLTEKFSSVYGEVSGNMHLYSDCAIGPPFCTHNPCGVSGQCQEKEGGYECHCLPGYGGKACLEEVNVKHLSLNETPTKSIPGALSAAEWEETTWRIDGIPDCGIGAFIENACEAIKRQGLMLRDNLNGPNLAQFVNCSERMYLHRPKPILWVHSKTKKFQVNFSISCAEEVDCDDNPCPFSSACTNVFGGYVCSCPPGFLGKNCADGSEVQEISLPVTPNIIPLNKWNWPLIFITTSRIVWKVNVPHACAVDVRAFRRFPPDRFALVTHFRSDGSVHSLLASITTRASFFARFKMRTIWIELEHKHAFDDFTVFSNCEKELRPGCFQGLCGVHSMCLNYQNGFICDCGFGYSGTYCLHADEDTLATIRNVSDSSLDVMVCKSSQLCSRKGCGTQVSLYDHLGSCSCDKDCEVFNDCCWDYTSVCQNSNHDVSDQSGGTGVLGIGGSFGIASESGIAGSSSLSTRDVAFLEGYEIPDTVKPEYMSCLPAKVFSYNFVTRCPEDWPPFSEERTKCELLPDVNDTLTIVPVSLGGAVTFKNVYCALCHGVSPPDLTGWKVNIHCGTDVQEDETNVIMERYRRGMCTLRFDDDSVRCDTCSALRHCFAPEIRTCPTHYEGLVVKEGCERFRAPFADYRKQETYENIYRNMYCFECNNPNHTSSGVETCISPTVITRAPIAGFPLTILVNFQDRNIVRVNNDGSVVQDENELCGKGQVFDVFNGVCRTISCSPGYQLLKGQCAMEVNCDTAKFSFEISYRVQNLTQCDSIAHVERVTDCLAHTVGIPVENISFVPPLSNDSIANFCFPPPADVNPFLRYKIETVLSVTDSIRRIVSLTTQHESVCDGHGLQYHVICSTAHENIECSGDWSPLATAINMALKMVGDGQYLVYRRNEDGRNPAHMAVRLVGTVWPQIDEDRHSFHREALEICTNTTTVGRFQQSLFCPILTLNMSDFRVLMIGNKTLLLHVKSDRLFDSSEFRLVDNETVQVCSFMSSEGLGNDSLTANFLEYTDGQSIMSTFCVTVSLVSVAVTLLTYIMFPSLRRLTSAKLVMCLCVFLFTGQLLTVVGSYAHFSPILCKTVSVITHYSWIAVFALTNSLAFDLHRTFGARNNFAFAQTSLQALFRHMIYFLGVPICVIVPCLYLDVIHDGGFVHYTIGELCWIGDHFGRFMAFGVPMAILLLINVAFFSVTALGIWIGYQNSIKVGKESSRSSYRQRVNLLQIYVKISSLMGFTWTVALVVPFVDVPELWYLFILLNGLQGTYVFLAFMVNVRVWNLWKCLFTQTCNQSLTQENRT